MASSELWVSLVSFALQPFWTNKLEQSFSFFSLQMQDYRSFHTALIQKLPDWDAIFWQGRQHNAR
jgi:hypothetical protein